MSLSFLVFPSTDPSTRSATIPWWSFVHSRADFLKSNKAVQDGRDTLDFWDPIKQHHFGLLSVDEASAVKQEAQSQAEGKEKGEDASADHP
jgi:hypothetical protein